MSNEEVENRLPHNIVLDLEYSAYGQPRKMNITLLPTSGWRLIEAIVANGPEKAWEVGALGIQIAQYIANPNTKPSLDDPEFAALYTAIDTVVHEFLGGNWKTTEDRVWAFTYKALQENRMKWEEAAHFASKVLEKPISPGALRKRLERWAPDHGFSQKIEKYRPRQTKK